MHIEPQRDRSHWTLIAFQKKLYSNSALTQYRHHLTFVVYTAKFTVQKYYIFFFYFENEINTNSPPTSVEKTLLRRGHHVDFFFYIKETGVPKWFLVSLQKLYIKEGGLCDSAHFEFIYCSFPPIFFFFKNRVLPLTICPFKY